MRKSSTKNQFTMAARQLGEKLIYEAKSHSLAEVQFLLEEGADPNYIQHTDANQWYSGDTHTALYEVLYSDTIKDQKNFNDVVQALLKGGADPNFKATRGNWNRSSQRPLLKGVSYSLGIMKDKKQKIRLIELFVSHGVNLNESETYHRSKEWANLRRGTCFIFQIMNSLGMKSKLEELAKAESSQLNLGNLKVKKQMKLMLPNVEQINARI